MSEYFEPYIQELSIDERRKLFSFRNKMTDIPSNFPRTKNVEKCWCGENEDMAHIYECKMLNIEENLIPYEKIYCGTISEQVEVFRRMNKSIENRENKLQQKEPPCDPNGSAAICSIG